MDLDSGPQEASLVKTIWSRRIAMWVPTGHFGDENHLVSGKPFWWKLFGIWEAILVKTIWYPLSHHSLTNPNLSHRGPLRGFGSPTISFLHSHGLNSKPCLRNNGYLPLVPPSVCSLTSYNTLFTDPTDGYVDFSAFLKNYSLTLVTNTTITTSFMDTWIFHFFKIIWNPFKHCQP